MALHKFTTPALFTKAMAALPYEEGMEEHTTVKTRFGDTVELGYREGDLYFVPREMVFHYGEDLRTVGDAVDLKIKLGPKNEQQERILAKSWELLSRDQSHILQAGTGTGKCLGYGTPVIMFDGSIKQVQDVKNGDLLMGPDSTPRLVTGVTKGYGPLYRVTPNKGSPFVCNDAHVLSLKRTRYFQESGNKKGGVWRGGDVVNISVTDYENKSKKFKHLMKLWRSGVDFPKRRTSLPPYFVGAYLGDGIKEIGPGRQCRITLCDRDIELQDRIRLEASKIGFLVREEQGRGCTDFYFKYGAGSSSLTFDAIKSLCVDGVRRIPEEYKINSREVRLDLLAGLLDTDGHYDSGCYEIVCKDREFSDDVLFLARSLGLSANVKSTVKGIKSSGFLGKYYRIVISGELSEIPCIVPRKKAQPRQQKKDVLMTGFSIKPIGEGDYYGFELDKDHLFLLGDFTVTHNTALSLMLAAKLGRRTLVVVTKDRMMQQWKDEITKFLGVPQDQIGHIQQDKMSCKDKPITVAMLHSLCRDKYPEWIKDYFGFIITDEVHNMGAETFSKVAGMFSAKYRLGLSATPKRSDRKEFVFMAHIGPVGVVADSTLLTPKVITNQTSFKLPLVTKKLPGGKIIRVPYPVQKGKLGRVLSFLATDQDRNQKIVNFIKQAYDKGRYIVVFTELVDKHLKPLRYLLTKEGIPVDDIGMFSRSAVSLNILDEQKFKRVVLTTFGQCSEAIDVPRWDTAVIALPRAQVKQTVGRVLREHSEKSFPVVFDLVDAGVPVLYDYYQTRHKLYKELGAEIISR